jgi:hypothetical protein
MLKVYGAALYLPLDQITIHSQISFDISYIQLVWVDLPSDAKHSFELCLYNTPGLHADIQNVHHR